MNMKSLSQQYVPPISQEPDANVAVIDINGFEVIIERQGSEKSLMDIASDWLVNNGMSWNDVTNYTEKKMEMKDIIKQTGPVVPELYVQYVNGGDKLEVNPNGNFIDLKASEDVEFKKGDFKLVDLGIATIIPEGHWGMLVARSSLFKNHGLIQTNAFGVIDTTYSGEDDHWMIPLYATRDTKVDKGERIAQFTLMRDNRFIIYEAKSLEEVKKDLKREAGNRGGFGSTGK